MIDLSIYNGKRVFLTGHTGFKGAWLCRVLSMLGASVTGYALEPPTEPSMYILSGAGRYVNSVTGDVRDLGSLKKAFDECDPDFVFHLAAQPIVRESYREPVYTYETNVMGTVNILECIRLSGKNVSFLNVTTDKVYLNPDTADHAFTEDEKLDGFDPYSNSKSCSELVTHSYSRSFFADGSTAISTARAGNVIGGGDFAKDRIIPDCVRAVIGGEPVFVRNPASVRPYQHVLDPLFAYLSIAAAQYSDRTVCGSYNVGPSLADCKTTGELAEAFVNAWGDGASWSSGNAGGPHEAGFLRLDNSLIREKIGFSPVWDFSETMKKTVEWYKAWSSGEDTAAVTGKQIEEYLTAFETKNK